MKKSDRGVERATNLSHCHHLTVVLNLCLVGGKEKGGGENDLLIDQSKFTIQHAIYKCAVFIYCFIYLVIT